MKQWTKRLLAALLVIGPAIVIAAVFLAAPKAETPRDEALPEGDLTLVSEVPVGDGDADHPASGHVALYWNGTGYVLRFVDYEARAGPNVWFYMAPGPDADMEEDGLLVRVPGPGQATYRGTFNVPLPAEYLPDERPHLVAWDRTFDQPYARATFAPAPDVPEDGSTGNETGDPGAATQHP